MLLGNLFRISFCYNTFSYDYFYLLVNNCLKYIKNVDFGYFACHTNLLNLEISKNTFIVPHKSSIQVKYDNLEVQCNYFLIIF